MDVDTTSNDSCLLDHSHINLALGYKLKILRESFGLSQRELAKKAGVTNSNISMIEQGQVSPSVHSLQKILDAFPISLADFFSCHLLVEQSPILEVRNISTYTSPEGVVVSQLNIGSKQIPELSRQVFQQNITGLLQMAGRDIVGWVLSGELRLQVATQYFSIKAQDAFHIRQGQVFCFANHHAKEAEILLATLVENR